MRGRRTGNDGAMSAPGGGLLGGSGADGGFVPDGQERDPGASGLGNRRRDRNRTSGGASTDEPGSADLERLAPLPDAPALYELGQKYHQGVITFQIELASDAPAAMAVDESGGEDFDS